MKFLLACLASAAALTFVSAVPQCTGDCESNFCPSVCYSSTDNLLCTCECAEFGCATVSCKDNQGNACTSELTLSKDDLNKEGCSAKCSANSGDSGGECNAFIFDNNFLGPRCKLLKACQTMEEAQETSPCSDCDSGRYCSLCPKLEYAGGSTMIHWVCDGVGDPYHTQLTEGTTCKPTHGCAAADPPVPAEISCSGGKWVVSDNPDADAPTDIQCPCSELRIPESGDTNLFCQTDVVPSDGQWTLDGSTSCDMVCDGSEFIPIQCRFDTEGAGTAWWITYNGNDIQLPKAQTCIACSQTACSEDPVTTTEAPTESTTVSSTEEPTDSTTVSSTEEPTDSTTDAPTESTTVASTEAL